MLSEPDGVIYHKQKLGLNMAAFQSAQVWQVRGEPQGMYNGLKYTKVYFITEINQIKA